MSDLSGCLSGMRPWSPDEEAVLRTEYGSKPAATIAKVLRRDPLAVMKKARRLGLRKRRRWTADDNQHLTALWGEFSVESIARRLKRSAATTYVRARQLGLPCGATTGLEYLHASAKRTGYTTGQLREILQAAGVGLAVTMSRPTGKRRRFHMVDPFDVDRAVEAWLACEWVESAAKVRGVCGETLRSALQLARDHGFDIPPEPSLPKGRWRVPSATVDEVLAWRARVESVTAAAWRLGVSRYRMTVWLTDAGLARPGKFKTWFVERETVDRVVSIARGAVKPRTE